MIDLEEIDFVIEEEDFKLDLLIKNPFRINRKGKQPPEKINRQKIINQISLQPHPFLYKAGSFAYPTF